MFKKLFSNHRALSKHQVLKHFIKTADKNGISRYYFDSYFKNLPNVVLQGYIKELADEDYLRPMLRHVILKAKAYSYLHDRRAQRFKKILSVLGRPVSYLLVWLLGIMSTLLVECLIRFIFAEP